MNICDRVHALRAELWDADYRPVAIYNWDSRLTTAPGKAPMGEGWQERARRNPPEAAEQPPDANAINTGVLCDGLRVLDIDVEDGTIVAKVRPLAIRHLGETQVRYRENSARILLPYRAAAGGPPKRRIVGETAKIEVLGRGQQFVAYGRHPTGALLRWAPDGLVNTPRHALPVVTELQIAEFFAEAMPLIGATKEKVDGATVHAEDTAELKALLETLAENGAGCGDSVERLQPHMQQRLQQALAKFDRLRSRWAGDVSDLRANGRDCSRSGQDFSLAALLKRADFNTTETAILLLIFDHGSAYDEAKYPDRSSRLRYVARTALRASTPDLRRQETARSALRLLRTGLASTDLLRRLHDENSHRPEPLPASIVDETALWAAALRSNQDAPR